MNKIEIEVAFDIGDEVYLKTDPKKETRLVACYLVTQNGVKYNISHMTTSDYFYDFELIKKDDLTKKIGF